MSTTGHPTKRSRSKTTPDIIAAEAVSLAREALVDVVGAAAVGNHQGVRRVGDREVVHIFDSAEAGYRGWTWRVLVARASRARVATVCETWLEPGAEAIVAPSWVPWAQRLRPEDISPSDRLAFVADDPRLMPGYQATDDQDADHFALWELGLGRERVLAPLGRDAAAKRWHKGEFGANNRASRLAESPCNACGYFVPMPGGFRNEFGVCSNEWSAADGRVVAAEYGCGAHTETDQINDAPEIGEPILDETGYEIFPE